MISLLKKTYLALCAIGIATLGASSAYSKTLYKITDIGNLGGYTHTYGSTTYTSTGTRATAISSSGIVVGSSLGSTGSEAFTWTEQSGMKGIGYLDASLYPRPESSASAISTSGAAVGSSLKWGGIRATLWMPDGGILNIGEIAGSGQYTEYSRATGINSSGVAVGNGWASGQSVAFTWTQSGGTKLFAGTQGFTNIQTGGINDAGRFTGSISLGGGQDKAFVSDSIGGIRVLDSLRSTITSSLATAINNAGTVIGRSYEQTTFTSYGFIWNEESGIQDIGRLSPDLKEISLNSINSLGQVVGANSKEAMTYSRAFLWSEIDGITDLNLLIDSTDPLFGKVSLREAMGINDSGDIIVNGVHDGRYQAYLLTPIPEPSTSALMLLGFSFLICWRGRYKQNVYVTGAKKLAA